MSVYLYHIAGCPAASDIDHTVHSLCFIPPLCARDSNREEEDAEEFGEGGTIQVTREGRSHSF